MNLRATRLSWRCISNIDCQLVSAFVLLMAVIATIDSMSDRLLEYPDIQHAGTARRSGGRPTELTQQIRKQVAAPYVLRVFVLQGLSLILLAQSFRYSARPAWRFVFACWALVSLATIPLLGEWLLATV
jgi:hypothetical protein